jgi:hypothetical protein
VDGNKAPYVGGWQDTRTNLDAAMARLRQDARAKGLGVLCGVPSGGLVFLDHDGASCDRLIEVLSESTLAEALPRTVTFTSGRTGRYQMVYRVPERYWDAIATAKIKTGSTGDDGKPEQIELRWTGCQSVIVGQHPETGAYRWYQDADGIELHPQAVEVAAAPGWMIAQMLQNPPESAPDLELLQPHSPEPGRWTDFNRTLTLPVPETIPLEICLAKSTRQLLNGSPLTKGRNDTGAAIARDLIGTANYLNRIGQRYDGDPEKLFLDWCAEVGLDKDSPKGQPRQIWNSALKKNPSPAALQASPDAIKTCIANHVYKLRQGVAVSSQPSSSAPRDLASKVRQLPGTAARLSLDATIDAIREALGEGLTKSRLQKRKIEIRNRSGIEPREFNDLWREVARELEDSEANPGVHEQLNHLLAIKSRDIPLSAFLVESLAEPLSRYALMVGGTPHAALTTLLPVVASCCATGTALRLIEQTAFDALPIVYSIVVSPSGNGKTPTQRAAIKPLERLQAEAYQRYQTELAEWKASCKQAKGEGEAEPEKPTLRHYYTTDATTEGVARIMSEQSGKGLLVYADEVSGFFNSRNAYRGGRGADKEKTLSAKDGNSLKVDRAGKETLFVAQACQSVTGSTQPETLRRLFNQEGDDFSDSSGQFARFLWSVMPITASRYPEGDPVDLSWLEEIYRRIEAFEPVRYELAPEALAIYKAWFNHLDQERMGEPSLAAQSVYAKMKTETGTLCLLLHLINSAVMGIAHPTREVSVETMRAAIVLAQTYLDHNRQVYVMGDEQHGDLTPVLAKIIELGERLGEASTRDVKRYIRSLKSADSAYIRELFKQLAKTGHGSLGGSPGKEKLVFTQNVDNVDKCRQNVDTLNIVQTTTGIEFQKNVDNVDTFSHSASTPGYPNHPEKKKETLIKNLSTVSTVSTNPENVDTASVLAVDSASTTVDNVDNADNVDTLEFTYEWSQDDESW